MFFLILLSFSFFYSGLIIFFIIGLFRLKKPVKQSILKPISIIIAARNEEDNIARLLDSLTQLNYPEDKYEIVVVDDRSADKTSEILKTYSSRIKNLKTYRIIKESENLVGKKQAIQKGIEKSSFEILAFTDADCVPSPDWLIEINDHFDNPKDFVAGYSPLIALGTGKILSLLKNLERAAIFSVTAGSFGWKWCLTCTARNMVYGKTLFNENNQFDGIGHIRSGDDDLMLQKLSPSISKTKFMFSQGSVVPSYDKAEIKEMIHLETRRASKWKYYPTSVKFLTSLILFYYILLTLALPAVFTNSLNLSNLGLLLLIKIIPEFLLLWIFLYKVKKLYLLLVFPLAEILYVPYYIFFGIKGTFGKYSWRA